MVISKSSVTMIIDKNFKTRVIPGMNSVKCTLNRTLKLDIANTSIKVIDKLVPLRGYPKDRRPAAMEVTSLTKSG